MKILPGKHCSGKPQTVARNGFHSSRTMLAALSSSAISFPPSTKRSLWWDNFVAEKVDLLLMSSPHMAAAILYSFSSSPKTAVIVASPAAALYWTVIPVPFSVPWTRDEASWCMPATSCLS